MNELLVEVIRIAPESAALLGIAVTGVVQRKRLAEVFDRLSGLRVAGVELQFVQRLADAQPGRHVPAPDLDKLSTRLARRHDVLRGARILWVDDAPIQNRVERAVFRRLGASVENALSTEEALSALRRDEFDVIITDMARDSATSGLELRDALATLSETPLIGYIGSVDDRGAPPGFFSFTDRPDQLVHAVINPLEHRAR